MVMRPVTISEIEESIKHANPNKAPGPGGFNAHFFKVCSQLLGTMYVTASLTFSSMVLC